MFNLYKLELKKIMKRKDFLCLMLFCLFPFLYGAGYYYGLEMITISGGEGTTLTGIGFISAMYGIAKMAGIALILFIIIGSTTLAAEVEKGQMSLILSKGVNKSRLIWAKLFGVITTIVLFTIVYNLSSIFNYVAFISKTEVGSEVFFDSRTLETICYQLLAILEMTVYVGISFLLGLKLSNYQTIFSTLAIFVFSQLLNYTKVLKYLSPSYLANLDSFGSNTMGFFLIGLVVLAIYILILTWFTSYRFNRMELK